MTQLIPEIRNTARALIVHQEKILLLRKEGGARGERFVLPGGAQDPGETLIAALHRECLEEIDTTVAIDDLIHVVDFFKLKDTQPPGRQHLVEFLFRCSIPENYAPHNGQHPDKYQVEVVWAELGELAQLPLYPQYLSNCIAHLKDAKRTFYLGAFDDHAAAQEY